MYLLIVYVLNMHLNTAYACIIVRALVHVGMHVNAHPVHAHAIPVDTYFC